MRVFFRYIAFSLSLLGGASLYGCADDSVEINRQTTAMETYLSNLIPEGDTREYTVHNGVYKFVISNNSENPDAEPVAEMGDSVSMNYYAHIFNSTGTPQIGNIFYTNNKVVLDSIYNNAQLEIPFDPDAWSDLDEDGYKKIRIGDGKILRAIDQALPECQAGDSIIFLIPSNRAFGDNYVGTVPPNSPLAYILSIKEIKKNQ